ncbi:hypothetical protein Slin15195_G080070 [Septoria linicola]|uniref:Uncharacterized protein n=1 Tax=Septoria linicola TaxID=215465 RepID=A0A9Q9AZ39_9PEZI|nr:hypothetical protein Slin15195_G080070 [Septoria linicola]
MKSNIHPIVAVTGNAQAHVESLIDRSKGDSIVDYRNGDDAVVEGIRNALKGAKLEYAIDCVSEKSAPANIAKVLDSQTGKTTFVLPDASKGFEKMANWDVYPSGVQQSMTQVVPGGLAGVQQGLENMKNGKASATKYIFRISETEGAGSGR